MTVTKDGNYKLPRPKKTRQGRSARTLLSATSRNKAKKPISEQINDLKIAGATFLVKLDEYIRHIDQSNN